MFEENYRFQVSPLPANNRWKWQVLLPTGAIFTSKEYYPTSDQAICAGQHWIDVETAFNALNRSLSQICGEGTITQKEYANLMRSFLRITKHSCEK
ncbi:hypothetical protein PN499_03950 [Kamptonema animale CS-326]|jgi:hypothetical protein|uniref:hypothetical protein n=1 Tax=Kamptonema TaxID=1501433 RepID=UPI0001DACF10|nr:MULTISPECIES: hypothetical protein [Kamptonema]MDB9510355.1 hypothetical protein [Kamptonema animale CS-326]CBN56396.1 conserved hypothetical protein [Kamptonema sp. PCC 6506]